ncbi:hypothetical protein EJB05_32076, partial [Eragrostis curvula]
MAEAADTRATTDMQEGGGSKSGPAGSHIDEAASNVSFTGRNESQPNMRINFRVPGYTIFMEDGNRTAVENKENDIAVNDVDGYTMKRKTYAKRKPKKPNIEPADTISPGSLTRRIVNLMPHLTTRAHDPLMGQSTRIPAVECNDQNR